MSFLKISDPNKRDFIVNEYLRLKKNIQNNYLTEKLGDINLQYDLTKLYKPITDSQSGLATQLNSIKEATSATTAALQALPTSLADNLKAITLQQYPSIEAYETEQPTATKVDLGELAEKYLRGWGNKESNTDKVFGIYDKAGQFYIGNSPIKIENDVITVGSKDYQGSIGLFELLTSKTPDKNIYTDEDLKNYAEILLKTKAIEDPRNPNKPKSSRSDKYKYIVKPIWESRPYQGQTSQLTPTKGYGINTIILPSDPNALVEMLSLRMSAFKAGNTGVKNEITAISDELLRQNIIDNNQYKNLMLNVS